jgi:hypothetical protein
MRPNKKSTQDIRNPKMKELSRQIIIVFYI